MAGVGVSIMIGFSVAATGVVVAVTAPDEQAPRIKMLVMNNKKYRVRFIRVSVGCVSNELEKNVPKVDWIAFCHFFSNLTALARGASVGTVVSTEMKCALLIYNFL
jgi:hypothetical protein